MSIDVYVCRRCHQKMIVRNNTQVPSPETIPCKSSDVACKGVARMRQTALQASPEWEFIPVVSGNNRTSFQIVRIRNR